MAGKAMRWWMAAGCAVAMAMPGGVGKMGAATTATLGAPDGLKCEHRVGPLAVAASHPHLSWLDHAASASLRGVHQAAYRVVVTDMAKNGDAWDSGEVASSQTIEVPYAGKPLQPLHTYTWKVMVWDAQHRPSAWSTPANWTVAPAPDAWTARWIADAPDASDPDSEGWGEGDRTPMPIFRHSFSTEKPVVKAMLYVTGLGQYEVHLNGAKVGDNQLTPGWTDYRKTVLYDTYDVTGMVRRGGNAIGVLLGNGMYNVRKTGGRYTKLENSMGQPKALVMLHLEFAQGVSSWVKSDDTWKTAKGPIRFSSTYGGEDYDATAEMPGWDAPGFDDTRWKQALAVDGPAGTLSAEAIPPIRVMQRYPVVSQKTLRPGVTVVDLGQNFAGWPAITVHGPRGSSVKLIPGELLKPDGSVSQLGSGGPQWFTYTLSGRGTEAWRPRFSYYGFRYVQVEVRAADGADGALPVVTKLTGEAVHTSAAETGSFHTTDSLLERTHMLILQAMRNNLVSVLTDCPHREKLGWLEESHLLGSALNYDFDLEQNYEKISDDIVTEQEPNGMMAEIAPRFVVFGGNGGIFDDSPEWGSATVLDPWIAYQRYGDFEDLQVHYASMRAYTDYLGTRAKGHIIAYGLGDWYDIGPGEPGLSKLTTSGVTATAIYYQDLQVMQKAAALLGKTDDAAKYAELSPQVREAFNSKFYRGAEQSYDRGSQTANAMPLVLGLVPEDGRKGVLDKLVADIHAHNDHVTAGDIGYHYVVDALLEGGRSDVLLAMLHRTDSPSYGYQLAQGATALTEAWDANPKDSQDHFMLGDAEEWFYRGLGGISVDMAQPEDEQITLHPAAMKSSVTSAETQYASVKGEIGVVWKQKGGTLDVTVPANTAATVFVPARDEAQVKEGGKPVAQAKGVTFVRKDANALVYRVESGTYHFAMAQ